MQRVAVLLASILLSSCGLSFPEDRRINGDWEVQDTKRIIEFKPPLEVADKGLQTLYLVMDSRVFEEATQTVDEFANASDDVAFSLRRKSDDRVWDPDVVIEDSQGNQRILERGIISNPTGDSSLIAVGFRDEAGEPYLREFVDEIHQVEIRSNYAVSIKALQWKMSRHPDLHYCMGACLTRWLPEW